MLSNSGGVGTDGSATPGTAAQSAEARQRMEKEIEVDIARQEESYKTLFERATVRPFVASYQKVSETQLSLHVEPIKGENNSSPRSPLSPVLHQIQQTEYKNSRHVFIWQDVAQSGNTNTNTHKHNSTASDRCNRRRRR